MRTRSSDDRYASPLTTIENIWQDCSQTSWTVTGYRNGWGGGRSRVTTDTVVPDFFTRRKHGEVFMNSFESVYEENTISDGASLTISKSGTPSFYCNSVGKYWSTRETGNTNWHYRAYLAMGLLVPDSANRFSVPSLIQKQLVGSDIGDLLAEVSTRVHSQRGRSPTNVWETLAEANRSLSMITNLSDTLLRRINQNRKRYASRRRRLTNTAKTAADFWLTYRYGLMPIIRDIGEVMIGLNAIHSRFVRETVRSDGQLEPILITKTGSQINSSATFHFRTMQTEELEIRAMALDEYYATLANRVGFTTKGLLTLAWELIPYSFVADWFVNIGDYIGGLSASPGHKLLGSCWTARRTQTFTVMPDGSTPASGYSCTSPTGRYHMIRTTVNRFPGLPLPSLVLRNDFGLTEAKRAMDSISLVVQRLKVPF